MVFSTQSIRSSLNSSFGDIKESFIDEDRSFFFETLSCVLEENKELDILIMSQFSNQVINEGYTKNLFKTYLSKIKLSDIISKIIDGFLLILENIWNNFKSFMLNFMNKNTMVKRYKDRLLKTTVSFYYPNEIYKFTNIDNSTSYTTFKNDIDKEYNNLIFNLSKFNEFKTYEALFSEMERIKNEIDLSDNYFDNLRGTILGSSDPVKAVDFAAELYKFFRNKGEVIPADSIISSNDIHRITTEYLDYNKIIKMIQKDQTDMKNYAKNLQKDIMKINIEDYVQDNLPKDAQKVFVKVLENKASSIKLTCNLYLQVFSAKLDAAKELFNQNAKILLLACKHIAKGEL